MRNDTKNNENNKPIIEVRNIGKKYDIAHMRGGYVALRDVIANIVRSPFSFLKDKAERAVGLKKKEEFWALKDVSFNINQGEVVGIIGANGAGKSTLLKILSQITPPTEGEIVLRGRVGSLLEVGTGFHPELTGRENIFLNGAILGMKKREIEKKFDEIVEFAGIGKFLDTPVKRYSSGMYVRLAFAVAAHMDPDILLIDEVLAVGDAEFQKKCLGKMDDITKREGRTILFVSHNLTAIKQLCVKTIVLQNGKIVFEGDTEKALEIYRQTSNQMVSIGSNTKRRGDKKIILESFHLEDADGRIVNSIENGSDVKFVFSYSCSEPQEIKEVDMGFSIHKNDVMVCKIYNSYLGQKITNIKNSGRFEFNIKELPIAFGRYAVQARVLANGIEADWPQSYIGSFDVLGSRFYKQNNLTTDPELTLIPNGYWTQG